MAPHTPVVVPRQQRRGSRLDTTLDAAEREVARTAELVLRLTALADRYDAHPDSTERVALMRATASLGQQALLDIAAEPMAI